MNKYIIKTQQDFFTFCGEHDLTEIALDFECVDASVLGLDVAGWSICNGDVVCYVDVADKVEWNQYEDMLFVLRQLLKVKTKTLIAHNYSFDGRILRQLDIPHTDNIVCTMTIAHLLDENKPKGLKWLTENVLGIRRKVVKFEDAISDGFSSNKFYTYALEDAEDTYLLYKRQVPRLHKQKLWDLWYNIERPFQDCLIDMAINGVLIDKDKLLTLQKEITEELHELELKMYGVGGIKYYTQYLFDGGKEIVPDINLDSPKQLINLLTKKLKVKLTETTDKGELTTGASALRAVANQHPFVGLLLEYRGMSKLLNAFLNPLPGFVQVDGRIRPSWNGTVAVTGRLSCSRPNLQQIPK